MYTSSQLLSPVPVTLPVSAQLSSDLDTHISHTHTHMHTHTAVWDPLHVCTGLWHVMNSGLKLRHIHRVVDSGML